MQIDHDIAQLVQQAMQLELNVSDLYLLFHRAYPQDGSFWWELVLEEKNHATLLKTAIEYFKRQNMFPVELFKVNLQDLQATNKEIQSLIDRYEQAPPTRAEAFQVALKIERAAGELHFQEAMSNPAESDIMRVFQRLNHDDKDHAKRISIYMEKRGIPND